ncbi:MAG: DUF4870 domain-containing protein [Thermoplasmata archaeon]|nr:MAG: DUF4870 domain-containing protein [Thermoplasmata archaeon]
MAKTSLGLEENIEGALCYLLGWVTGIVFYLLEKDNKFVKFHARQSILTFFPLWILSLIFGGWWGLLWWHAWIFFWWISWLIWLVMFILWIVLMIKAYQGEMFKLPIVGDIAEKGI